MTRPSSTSDGAGCALLILVLTTFVLGIYALGLLFELWSR